MTSIEAIMPRGLDRWKPAGNTIVLDAMLTV
jgi:hypothetical protein